jgi:hypothetical protein
MAKARGMTFKPTRQTGLVGEALVGSTNLASGCYAMIDDRLGLSLVLWQPVLDQHVGTKSRVSHAQPASSGHSGEVQGSDCEFPQR